jgi:general secretion pathway protein G
MRKQRGFTLIELLIVVAIIGIIAAIAIPNLLDAIQRARQKRSIGDCRNLAGAIQTFGVDNGGYPFNNGVIPATSINAVVTGFTPDYIQAIPPADGWGASYQYKTGAASVARATVPTVVAVNFALWSLGSDGKGGAGNASASIGGTDVTGVNPDASPLTPTMTPQTQCYQSDICWVDSSFVQVPDGKQKSC